MDIQALQPTASPKSASVSTTEPVRDETEGFEEELMMWMGEQPPEVSWVEQALLVEEGTWNNVTKTPALPLTGMDLSFGSAAIPTTEGASDAWAPAPMGAPALVTEQHQNVQKLVRYLQQNAPGTGTGAGATPAGTEAQPTGPASSDGSDPDPGMQLLIADEPESTIGPQDPPTPEVEPKSKPRDGLRALFSSATADSESLKTSFGESSSFADSDGAGSNPMLAHAQEGGPTDVRHGSQLGASARRLIADARLRSWGSGVKVPLELQLDEASVPMRLKFSPRGDGSHEVRFVVATPRDRRELRRQMPELESALADLPVQIADVQVEVDPTRVNAQRSTR